MGEIRDSIALLGLDLKITDELRYDPQLRCMEINGARSGISGYKRANGTEADIAQKLDSVVESLGLPAYFIGSTLADALDWKQIPFNGEGYARAVSRPSVFRPNPVSYMGDVPRAWLHPDVRPRSWKFLKMVKDYTESDTDWSKAEAVVFDRSGASLNTESLPGIVYDTGHRNIFNEGRVMVANPPGIEALLYDKSDAEVLFEDESFMIPERSLSTFILFGFLNRLSKLDIHPLDTKYVVVKPSKGSNAFYVDIMRQSELLAGKRPQWSLAVTDRMLSSALGGMDYAADIFQERRNDMVVQEFVPGKPVKNPDTGKSHSASMRYLVVMTTTDGNIQMHPIGGYWRLAPQPLDIRDRKDNLRLRFIANLHPIDPELPGAIPIPISADEDAFVRQELEQVLPKAYGRMLHYEKPALSGSLDRVLRQEFQKTTQPIG